MAVQTEIFLPIFFLCLQLEAFSVFAFQFSIPAQICILVRQNFVNMFLITLAQNIHLVYFAI